MTRHGGRELRKMRATRKVWNAAWMRCRVGVVHQTLNDRSFATEAAVRQPANRGEAVTATLSARFGLLGYEGRVLLFLPYR